MRYYGFGNFYLRSIQQGIQAFHGLHDMFNHYDRFRYHDVGTPLRQAYDTLQDWSHNHKTMLLKNGGMADDLHDLFQFLETGHGKFPFVAFHEEKASLNHALTHVGIVVPNYIWETADADRRFGPKLGNAIDGNHRWNRELTEWEEGLIVRMNSCGLAS
jgi:hypothetical protein